MKTPNLCLADVIILLKEKYPNANIKYNIDRRILRASIQY